MIVVGKTKQCLSCAGGGKMEIEKVLDLLTEWERRVNEYRDRLREMEYPERCDYGHAHREWAATLSDCIDELKTALVPGRY